MVGSPVDLTCAEVRYVATVKCDASSVPRILYPIPVRNPGERLPGVRYYLARVVDSIPSMCEVGLTFSDMRSLVHWVLRLSLIPFRISILRLMVEPFLAVVLGCGACVRLGVDLPRICIPSVKRYPIHLVERHGDDPVPCEEPSCVRRPTVLYLAVQGIAGP